MSPDEVTARLEAILSGVRRLRASLYPANWKYDPFLQIEQDLTALLRYIKDIQG